MRNLLLAVILFLSLNSFSQFKVCINFYSDSSFCCNFENFQTYDCTSFLDSLSFINSIVYKANCVSEIVLIINKELKFNIYCTDPERPFIVFKNDLELYEDWHINNCFKYCFINSSLAQNVSK